VSNVQKERNTQNRGEDEDEEEVEKSEKISATYSYPHLS